MSTVNSQERRLIVISTMERRYTRRQRSEGPAFIEREIDIHSGDVVRTHEKYAKAWSCL